MKRLRLMVAFAAAACVDAPFEHTNPFDAKMPLTMTLIGGADTVATAGTTLLYQVVTDPVVVGYVPVWSSSDVNKVNSLGYGRFVVIALPTTTPTALFIRARFGDEFAERQLILLPAP